MNHRFPGRTGVLVGPYYPGTMVLGTVGDPDHDESIRGMALVPMAIAFVARGLAVTF